ncbi:MAG: hypothetical protein JSV80_06615, partial [Acidobacteriota bacterium]
MKRWRSTVSCSACLLLVASLPPLLGDADPPRDFDDAWGELPTGLVGVLGAKSDAYARRALNFTCTEQIRRATYRESDAAAETRRAYEYLLVADPTRPEGYSGLRGTVRSGGRNEVEVEMPFPEPYLWTQLFAGPIRSTLRFKVGEWHTTPYKLAIPIFWESSAPVFEGKRITEWSGQAAIEYRSGNLLSLTAQPNLQAERIVMELERFLTAFRIMGFSTAPPPVGRELTVRFDFEHDGFTYPTHVSVHTFRQVARDARTTVGRETVQYADYRFFGTEVRDEIPPLLYNTPARLDPNEASRGSESGGGTGGGGGAARPTEAA